VKEPLSKLFFYNSLLLFYIFASYLSIRYSRTQT